MLSKQNSLFKSVCLVVLLSSPGLAHGQDTMPNGTVIANVGGVEITGVDIAIIAEKTFEQLSQLSEDQRSDYLLQTALDMNLMALAAKDLKLDETPLLQRRIAFEQARLLQEAYVLHIAAEATSTDKIAAAYESYLEAFIPIEQRRLSHVLVRTKDDAEAAVRRIEQGEDFDTVGREVSIDPAGKDSLDLGFITENEMVAPLNAAAFSLADVGEVSEPVSTQFGWHILRYEEQRLSEPDSLENSQERIAADLVAQKMRSLLEELSALYGVQMLEPQTDTVPMAN